MPTLKPLRSPALIFALALAGCSHLPLGGEDAWVIDALGYAQQVAARPAEAQRREVQSAQQAFARDKNTSSRLRLALLLSQPNLAGHDEGRAAALLEPLVSGSDGSARALASLLLVQINERQKGERQSRQMKDQLDELRSIERSLIERERPRKK
jgi:hypothetical protein